MGPSVYVETSIISYLAARPSRDLIVAARQQVTHAWWRERRPAFDLYVSQVVLDEILAGDPDAAERRAALVAGIPVRVEQVCRENGYPPPVLCTPDELMGGSDD